MFCFKNKKEISEDVGAAAGTTARHAGLKVAAVILAGAVGGGGVTYGVVKNADKIPERVANELMAEVSDTEGREKADTLTKIAVAKVL